ncbi:protocadherin Fat 4-like [Eleutherodactylus coqui]|uniref:protocadherin Fat 4-like n=1 Tax=Eleutherodactylus coqui TaxID=57060 RepID=UPI003462E7B0
MINRYNLEASAEDSVGFSSMVPVRIDIQDVDTMNPHFNFAMYEGLISENQRGSVSTHPEAIKAVDGDLGINETVYYSISMVHPAEFWNAVLIDRSNGTISVIKEIDRETVSLLSVEIKATQQNNHLKSADSVVMVTILDENDNTPQFSQSIYEAVLPENSPPGSMILVLTASDKDKDGLTNGYFRTNNTMFTVDINGVMYFSHGELDRELTSRIPVRVWVFDAPSGGRNSSAEITINITDVNDNNPIFHNLPLHYSIPEGNYKDTTPVLVATLNVTDLDSGINGNVTITSDAENGDKNFRVLENGKIFVHGQLDREVKDKYVMSLIASDGGNPPRQSFADAVIVIEDINDNVPTFTKKEYSTELILKNVKAGDRIMSVSALDLDIGNNTQISYRFAQPHSGFGIDEETGDIFLTNDVPAATVETNIVIPVIATDHGVPPLSSTATIIIKVSEGQPEFVNSNSNFSIPEGMPLGSHVGSVEISAGPDVSVTYSVQTYTTVFSITEKGTIMTRVVLDREEQDSYIFIVTAVDSQTPPKTAAIVVTITVTDVNDNLPVFSLIIDSNVTCLENKNFLDLANITATDLDIGNNSAITYSLENDFNNTFHIDSSTGKLMNIKPLDADKTNSYDLKVIARDSGIPPLSSTTVIHVDVQDVDDNGPIFKSKLYNVTVKENEPPHVILNVSAMDTDTGSNAAILYSFTEASDLFYIGKESGFISNLKPLDFEAKAEHVLTVIAYSPRNHHSQNRATVRVHIEDVNEEGPMVEYATYHTVIWDGEYATGSIILDINAKKINTSMDEGIHYSISGDNSENLFSIANGTGHIFLTKDLPKHSFPEYYAFKVNCTDSWAPPQSTVVQVFVVISPSNVTVPVFSADYYNPEMLNNWTAPHTYLIQIKAFYLHSSLIYSISEEENKDYFDLDPLSGIMTTRKVLKMEDFPTNVTVKATDSQRPSIYSEAIVHVTVINGNQYAPVFTNYLENVTVKEEQSTPTFIVQVQAADDDPGRNGILTYSILNNHSHTFTIDATNGKVSAATTFDFENGPHEFQIFICAEDYGMPHKKQGYLTLIVRVLDINDWKPVFSPHGSMYVEESTPAGTVIGHITATDKDHGDNAFIVYRLTDDNDQFGIDGLLGNIFVKRHLDHEAKAQSNVTVTASNNKTAPFYQSRTHLTIYILDKNDNAPQFTQKMYFAELDVNSPIGTFVMAVNATDRDEGNNGVVEYSLLSNLSSPYFLVENIRDGKIITATNHLKPGEVKLSVVAKDKGSPSLSNIASVMVNLVNKTETSPKFSPNEVSTVLKKNKPKEEPVFTFSAQNAVGKNVTYRIVAGNDKGQFYLDEKTGKLWTTDKFNGDVQQSYNITVEAITPPDTQGPLSPNMAQLQITVPEFKEGPVFEQEIYIATIVNTVPRGFHVIKVTARSSDSASKLIYSLVDQSENTFDIDNYTGQIVAVNVARKTGHFHFKAQVTDQNGLSAQTEVQIQVKSPSPSHDVADIKVNETVQEVQQHIPDLIRMLEQVLQSKVTNISLESDAGNKQSTRIKFEVAGESHEDMVRKLTDKLSTVQKQLSSIFEKPINIVLPKLHNFVLSTGAIAGIATFFVVLAVLVVLAAVFGKSKASQLGSKTASNESIDGIPSESNDPKIDNGDETPNIDDNQDGGPKVCGGSSETETDEHVVDKLNKKDETPSTDDNRDGGPKVCGGSFETETDEHVVDDINKGDETPNIDDNQDERPKVCGGSFETETDEHVVDDINKGDETPSIDDYQDEGPKVCGGSSETETDEHVNDELNKSTATTEEQTVDVQKDDTVTDTPEPTVTDTPELTVTDKPELTVTDTPESTVTDTPEATVTDTPESTVTDTPESTVRHTPESTVTHTPESTVTDTPESTVTDTPESTVTDTPESTVTDTPESTVTDTPGATVTDTPESIDRNISTEPSSTATTEEQTVDVQKDDTVTDTPEPTVTDTPEATMTDTPEATDEKASTEPSSMATTEEQTLDVEITETVTDAPESTDENSMATTEEEILEVEITETVTDDPESTDGNGMATTEEQTLDVEITETVTDAPESTYENSMATTEDQTLDQTVTDTAEPTGGNSMATTEEQIPDVQITEAMPDAPKPTCGNSMATTEQQTLDETVTDTPEPTGGNTSVEPSSEPEASRDEVEEDKTKEGQQLKLTKGTEVEYVETWESFDSNEDSNMESATSDETQKEISESPATATIAEPPKSGGNEKMTVSARLLDDE